MERNLIYDVGIHRGFDSTHYLALGYRVIAIDADPRMIRHCSERFASEIESGMLTLLNVGIAEQPGVLPFYSSEHDDWNSFDPSIAGRNGTPFEVLNVECVPFSQILCAYGVPYYLKIDIEGCDLYCIKALSATDLPTYVSCEMSTTDALSHLRALGYSRFKLIDQRTHFTLSSGPFGEQTAGPWRTIDDVYYEWLHPHRGHPERCEFMDTSAEAWFDVYSGPRNSDQAIS
jgi:FkbM family methyltransferase